jgi:hypothetical protein
LVAQEPATTAWFGIRLGPTARMIFYSEKPQVTPGEGGKITVKTNAIFVPNNVFDELGIKIEKKD